MYKEGMKVMINQAGHDRFGGGCMNPANTVGVVVGQIDDDPEWYDVLWPNGEVNAYTEGSLDIVEG